MAWFNYPKQLTFNILTFTELFLIVLWFTFITISQILLQGCIYVLRNTVKTYYTDWNTLTWASSPWQQHRCFSSGGPGRVWPAGWIHNQSLWHRHHSRAAAPHTGSALTPHRYCASRCHAADPAELEDLYW